VVDSIVGLGSVSIYRGESVPAPVLAFSALSLDEVRQAGVGASYNERWKGVGTLSLGVLVTDYRRTLDIPGSPGSAERTSQVLPTASFTVDAGKHANGLRELHSGTRGFRKRADIRGQPRRAGAGHADVAGGRWSAGRAAQ